MHSKVVWIGIRPERESPLQSRPEVYADRESGLSGDHPTKPHRQVTLISKEAMENVARILEHDNADPAKSRRNILLEGLDFNLSAGDHLRIGEALIEITGPCLPCDRMNETFGEGGRIAMADAGGLTGRILQSGYIRVGDSADIIEISDRASLSSQV